MYTDDQNAQVVLSLLKKYGIKKMVVSPGTTNVPITRSVQIDPWFEIYSVVDERSAAYFATGLAYESGEPVVISCTGATASRNYVSGLTEAYYRNLPVIALTSQHHVSDYGNLAPQVTDRTVSQNDIKKISVHLPVIKDAEDLEKCIIYTNKALIAATTRGCGPVHINLPVNGYSFTTPILPDVRKINYISTEDLSRHADELNKELSSRRFAVFIGAHRKFNAKSEKLLQAFAVKYDAAVIVDHTSSYKGKNAIPLAQIADILESPHRPELVIDLGSITGEYSIGWMSGVESWRVSEDGQMHDRFHNLTKLFDCSEDAFFAAFAKLSPIKNLEYHSLLAKEISSIKVPELPLSNTLISYELSQRIPPGSNLHLGILNSLRNMNYFNLHKTIDTSSNVGGFGIDGALSTLIGQSMVNKNKLTFGLVGDLAAFYDMNSLGIRHIGNNIRILLVNNNGGVEFRLNKTLEPQWSTETNEYIAARGHNGSMRAWAESMGFYYMSSTTKQDFLDKVGSFCAPDVAEYSQPVLFEVFTDIPDEQNGVESIHEANRKISSDDAQIDTAPVTPTNTSRRKMTNRVKKLTPEVAKRIYRKLKKT